VIKVTEEVLPLVLLANTTLTQGTPALHAQKDTDAQEVPVNQSDVEPILTHQQALAAAL